uniref:Methyltransferase n=1 Tax=viral metagenome TaxID=1070528 RepID=A0A6C0HPW4_9ZZZZ
MVSLALRGKSMTFKGEDDYNTPKSAWECISLYLPKNKIIYEPFYSNGSSGRYLRELGCINVIHDNVDFFTNSYSYDVIVSNPPFSHKQRIFKELERLDKPFILLLPVSVITKQFYRYFSNKCGLIIPPNRIQFEKNNVPLSRCWFDCIFVCYKIDGVREREIIYIE